MKRFRPQAKAKSKRRKEEVSRVSQKTPLSGQDRSQIQTLETRYNELAEEIEVMKERGLPPGQQLWMEQEAELDGLKKEFADLEVKLLDQLKSLKGSHELTKDHWELYGKLFLAVNERYEKIPTLQVGRLSPPTPDSDLEFDSHELTTPRLAKSPSPL